MTKPNSLITLSILGILVLMASAGCTNARADKELHKAPLAEMRRSHKTELMEPGPNPAEYENTRPNGVEEVKYDSDGRKLLAWIVKPNLDGKRPAVLFAHGGEALGESDVEAIMPFVNAGYLVMLPAWRGENGNPGNYEMCYGEVDDAVNALEYLSKRKDVDKNMICAAGHSIGGTIVMLLAQSTDKLKKATACGGLPAMNTFFGAYPDAPFVNNSLELALRSPREYVQDLSCPLRLYYGSDSGERRMKSLAKAMVEKGRKAGKTIEIVDIPGEDHFGALSQAIPQMVQYFSTNNN